MVVVVVVVVAAVVLVVTAAAVMTNLPPIVEGPLHDLYLGTSFLVPAEYAHCELFECVRIESGVVVLCDGLSDCVDLVGVLLIEADVDYGVLQC